MKPHTARTFAVVALAAAALFLLHRLIAPILWASVIAVATWPVHERLRRVGGGGGGGSGTASALILTGAVVLFLVVPVTFLGLRAWREAPELIALWTTSRQSGLQTPDWLATLPWVGPWAAQQWHLILGEPGALDSYGRSILGALDFARGRSLLGEIARHAMAFFFCLLVLFFLYLDGDLVAQQIDTVVARQLGPAGRRTLVVVVRSVRGAVNGLVLVGLGLGVLMAVAYELAGVPHPAALGLATGLLGTVPFGAAMVLAPVALYLFAVGKTTAAMVLIAAGALTIFLVDHFVRPVLLAAGLRLPLVLALLGIVGGLETFGVLGLFLGPTLLALVAAVWRELAAPPSLGDDAPARP
ncbi:MAG: AI-2E family transporter [Caldimonas sp.]